MCDYEEFSLKSTDDFHTYNDREPGMYHRDNDDELSPGEIDGYGNSEYADEDFWRDVESELMRFPDE